MRLTRMRVGVGASGAAFHRAGVLALVAQVGCAANVTRAADAPDFAQGPVPAASPFPMSTPASGPSAAAASFAAADAQRLFARVNSCPADRITTTPASADTATPPPDVAADPGRLAVWQQNHVADGRKRVDVSGCGHSMRFACNVFSGRSDAFCLPDVSGGINSVIIDPAAAQNALAQIERAEGGGRPKLGVAFAAVPGIGLVVAAVLPGGAAAGKLRGGDVILAAGGQRVADAASLAAVVEAAAGTPLDVKVRRDGQETTVTVDIPAGVTTTTVRAH